MMIRYLKWNFCSECEEWVRDKSITLCPKCHTPLRLGNGQSKKKHGIIISGITGRPASFVDQGVNA